ncbi:MAG: helix-turn-helix transcriptional regulator [Marinilabiliaceae bacterium]|nr:helix-turn-helix transcriptional regulator [Marinilabiliaceae bacterium]
MNTFNAGSKIKEIRQLKNISIDELASRSGLDINQIEMIESGSIMPSIAPIIKIARALSVRPGTFLDDEDTIGPIITKSDEKTEGTSFSSTNINNTNLSFFPLANGKSGRHMEPFIIHVTPTKNNIELSSTHEGEEFIYVISGSIEIKYGNDTFILNTGDSIYYDSIINHKVIAANQSSATILAVVYIPE